MTPRKRYLEAIWLKASKMQIKKKTEKVTNNCQIMVKNMLKVLTGEASKGYKKKNRYRRIKNYV